MAPGGEFVASSSALFLRGAALHLGVEMLLLLILKIEQCHCDQCVTTLRGKLVNKKCQPKYYK